MKKVVVSLFIALTCALVSMNIHKEETVLDDVKINNIKEESSSFAIMLEKSGEEGVYERSDNGFPESNYTYNKEKSGCMDIYGSKLDDVLIYDEGSKTATVNTNKTNYCYLYFDNAQ